MKTIHKYVLPAQDDVVVKMPIGAKILQVAAQREEICLWAEVDTAKKLENVEFEINGTGHELSSKKKTYLGTAQLHQGRIVLHVFRVVK